MQHPKHMRATAASTTWVRQRPGRDAGLAFRGRMPGFLDQAPARGEGRRVAERSCCKLQLGECPCSHRARDKLGISDTGLTPRIAHAPVCERDEGAARKRALQGTARRNGNDTRASWRHFQPLALIHESLKGDTYRDHDWALGAPRKGAGGHLSTVLEREPCEYRGDYWSSPGQRSRREEE